MQVDFYQLAGTPIEDVVPQLAEKVLETGERLLLICGDDRLRALLDEQLWTRDPASYLPHAQSKGEGDAIQPILLSDAVDAPNGARFAMIADGHWRDETLGFERVFYLFDNATLDEARQAWRSLAGKDDAEPRYWKREGGRWRQGP